MEDHSTYKELFDLLKQYREQGPPVDRYFFTIRVPGADGNLHRSYRSSNYSTLGKVRGFLSTAMAAYNDGKREGTVGTIFRINVWRKSETIEHAVIVEGEVRHAYRTSRKWYEEVAPFIKTSYYYQNSHLPPFLREELNLQDLEE